MKVATGSVDLDDLDPQTGYRASVRRAAWRIIPQIDKNPRIVKFAESISGRVLLFVLFGIILELVTASRDDVLGSHFLGFHFLGFQFDRLWILITSLAATCVFAGRYRWWVIPFATGIILYQNNFWFDPHLATIIATQEGIESQNNFLVLRWLMPLAVFVLSASVIYSARRFRDVFIFRRPIVCSITFFTAMVFVAEFSALHGMPRVILWSFIGAFAPFFGFSDMLYSRSPASLPLFFATRNIPPILGILKHALWEKRNLSSKI
jgi:hypothetical protein